MMPLEELIQNISQCTLCAPYLELGPRPIFAARSHSRIIVIGQAPGLVVHKSGIAWDDKSGDNLRQWMGIDKETFYNTEKIAIVPMGFCYPGKGKTGDLPPRKECAPLWHPSLLSQMNKVQLVLLIGKYAQDYYLKSPIPHNLTERVRQYRAYLPHYFVLPHPSPRNNIWQAKNPWFKAEVIPELQALVKGILAL